MFALRFLVLLNLIALCSFATTVNPLVGYLQWSSDNSTGQGWFEVGIHTNTEDGSAELPDYIKLVNVGLEIDIRIGQSVLTQSVSLHRAFSQSQVVNEPSTNVLFPSMTCSVSDCPGGPGSYFTQAFGPNAANGFVAPTIIGARFTYTAIAHTTTLYDPHWRYTNMDSQVTTRFTPEMIARTVSLVPGSSNSFVYNGSEAPVAFLDISGQQVPEPSTFMLCGAGIAVAVVHRFRRASSARQ